MKTILFVCFLMAFTSSAFAAGVPDCVSLARADRQTIDDYYYPHESNCNLYYQCAEYGLVKMQCPKDLHFDSETNQCGWPGVARCEA